MEAKFTDQSISSAVIEGLAERAGGKELMMPNGSIRTIESVKHQYSESVRGLWSLANSLVEADLERIADRLAAKSDYDVVIFGHTHKPKMDKDTILVTDRIYVNSGCWYKETATFVEVTKTPDELKRERFAGKRIRRRVNR